MQGVNSRQRLYTFLAGQSYAHRISIHASSLLLYSLYCTCIASVLHASIISLLLYSTARTVHVPVHQVCTAVVPVREKRAC